MDMNDNTYKLIRTVEVYDKKYSLDNPSFIWIIADLVLLAISLWYTSPESILCWVPIITILFLLVLKSKIEDCRGKINPHIEKLNILLIGGRSDENSEIIKAEMNCLHEIQNALLLLSLVVQFIRLASTICLILSFGLIFIK